LKWSILLPSDIRQEPPQAVTFRKITPADRIVLSFVSVILAGTLLLHLPVCSSGVAKVHLRACLFTVTSAVCVTGLTVKDTGKDFSLTGQILIMLLIQVGGLGILTFSNWLLISLRGSRSDLGTRMLLSESHGSLPHIEPVKLLKQIVLYTLLCEGIGTGLLYTSFSRDFPPIHAFWQALFHSVAAFCNAGFSLFTDNLIGYQSDTVVNLTIDGLIVSGGLGFIVFSDVTNYFMRGKPETGRKRLSFHSRVVLTTTAFLVVCGALICMALEWRNTMAGFNLKDKVLASLMLSITPRTAGFNTVDTGMLTNTTLSFLILLMGIGASPGSTGGGVKTTTFAVLIALVWSRSRGHPKIEWMGRTIPLSVLSKAVAVGAAYTLVTMIATMFVDFFETAGVSPDLVDGSRGLFLKHLFEVVSALGTVGLSTGITPHLTGESQILLVFVMLVGRLGPLLLADALIGGKKAPRYSLPDDYVMVG
jgi:trk system potassium uptake protein TrkH